MADDIPEASDAPPSGMNLDLGSLIKNFDIKKAFENFAAKLPDGEDNAEMRAKVHEAMEKYESMSDVEKAAFGQKIKEQLMSKLAAKFENSEIRSQLEGAINSAIYKQIYLAIAGILLIIFLVFFGYKLYKSIKEKELKKVEKKKAKELKKKK